MHKFAIKVVCFTLLGLLAPLISSAQAPGTDHLFVFARAEPSNISLGQNSTIHIMAALTRPTGSLPAVGARVTLTSGGGMFTGGTCNDAGCSGTAVTDASGRASIGWTCNGPCSPGYLMAARAELAGTVSAEFTFWVETTGAAAGQRPGVAIAPNAMQVPKVPKLGIRIPTPGGAPRIE